MTIQVQVGMGSRQLVMLTVSPVSIQNTQLLAISQGNLQATFL